MEKTTGKPYPTQLLTRKNLQLEIKNAKLAPAGKSNATAELKINSKHGVQIKVASKTDGISRSRNRQGEIPKKKSALKTALKEYFKSMLAEADGGPSSPDAATPVDVERLMKELAQKPINPEIVDQILSSWEEKQASLVARIEGPPPPADEPLPLPSYAKPPADEPPPLPSYAKPPVDEPPPPLAGEGGTSSSAVSTEKLSLDTRKAPPTVRGSSLAKAVVEAKVNLDRDIEKLERTLRQHMEANIRPAPISSNSQEGNAQNNDRRIESLTKNPAKEAFRAMDNHRYTSQFLGAGTLVKELDNLVKSDKGAGRWKVNHQTKSVIAQRAVFDAQLTRFIRPAQVNRLIGHNPIADLATVHYLKSIQEEASKSEIDVQKILGLAKSWKRVLHYAITPDEQKSPKPEDLDALSFWLRMPMSMLASC